MTDEFVPRKECALLCEKLEAEDKHQNERIDKLEKSQAHITELTISVKELALEVKNMVAEVASQNTRIKTLESRDGGEVARLGEDGYHSCCNRHRDCGSGFYSQVKGDT